MKNKILLLFALTVHVIICRGDNLGINNISAAASGYKEYIPSVFPPSPTAYKMSMYGQIPLNGSTGAFSYSIPIYTIQEKDITLPITLDYNSNGVKIDELSTIVGTDWNLNIGGVISRVMRGHPDENTERWYPENIYPSSDIIKQKINQIGNEFSIIDVERDWFTFSINGISGSFYFDENLNPIVSCKEFVKIKFEEGASSGLYGSYSTFTIADGKGNSYIFGGSSDYLEGTVASSTNTVGPKDKYFSSWYLKEIVSANLNRIKFTYNTYQISYYSGTYFGLIFDQICNCDGINVESFERIYTPNLYNNVTVAKAVAEIRFTNGNVNFTYNTGRSDGGGVSLKEINIKYGSDVKKKILLEYETTLATTSSGNFYDLLKSDSSLKYRLFLKSVTCGTTSKPVEEKYYFDYYEKEKLPSRLSFVKDKYGYYNGENNVSAFSSDLMTDPISSAIMNRYGGNIYATANNSVRPDLVYYGMLKQIHYPTGGYTQISYEANSNREMGTELKYKNYAIEIMKDCKVSGTPSKSLTFVSNGSLLKFRGSARLYEAQDCPPPSPDSSHDLYSITVQDITTGTILLSVNTPYETSIDYSSKPIQTTSGHTYSISISLLSKPFNPASGSLDVEYNAESVPIEKTVYGGGARVKEIADYTDAKSDNKRTFYYNSMATYPSNKTTLTKITDPKYAYMYSFSKNCASYCTDGQYDPFYLYKKLVTSSSSISLMYDNRKQASYYTTITEFMENNGSKNGAVERTFYPSDDYQCNIILEPEVPGAPYSNEGDIYYGLLQKEEIYKYESGKFIITNCKNYVYSSVNTTVLSSYIFRKNYELSFASSSTEISNISGIRYFNYISNTKLIQVIDSTYLPNGAIKTETTNSYGSAPYFNLTNQSVSSSTGGSIINKYLYAPDLAGQLSYMDQLTNTNRISTPIILEKKRKDPPNYEEKQTSYIKLTYNQFPITQQDGTTKNMVMPEFVYSLKGGLPSTAIEKRLTYNKYDEYGNVIEYTLDEGKKVIVLWSYGGQYPVAEIKNATYDEVKSIIGITPESFSTAATPNTTLLDNLRKNLANAHVTTYKYNPLFGILESTNAAGVISYYSYDLYGRLSEIYLIDNNTKKVIQSFNYNILNQ